MMTHDVLFCFVCCTYSTEGWLNSSDNWPVINSLCIMMKGLVIILTLSYQPISAVAVHVSAMFYSCH